MLAGWLVLWLACWSVVQAAVSYEMLASFQKPGTSVVAPLVQHADGNFYGVAAAGGAMESGSVFKMTPAGVLSTVFAFSGPDGSDPVGGLVVGADQALYGTTSTGGASGFGVAFKVTTAGVFTKLVDFTGASGAAPGSVPQGLVLHADGNFYGVTQAGGSGGFGTVFKMTPAGVVTTLVEFTGNTGLRPGSQPIGPLAVSGNQLYGVTRLGGASGLGVIYEVSTSGTWRSLGEFSGATGSRAGANPAGGLLMNTDGLLYGTAEFGGTNGFGTAFKITTAVSPVYTVLRQFADASGSQPVSTLVRGTDGLLYGCTANGGVNGFGTVFNLSTTGTHTLLASLSGESGATAGSSMRGGLVMGTDGLFYGITSAGGAGNLGAAFKISSAGSYTSLGGISLAEGWMPSGAPVFAGGDEFLFPVAAGGASGGGNLMSFTSSGSVSVAAALGGTLGSTADGGLFASGADFYGVTAKGGASARGTMYRYHPVTGAALVSSFVTSGGSSSEGALILGGDGLFYGVSREGGATSRGTIYRINNLGTRTRLVSFTGTAGAAPGMKPRGPLVLAGDGNFYGLTEQGGAANTGVIFRLTAAGAYSVVSAFGSTGPRSPQGGFAVGNDGLLYATTSLGGTADAGTLIRFDPATNLWEVLGEFTNLAGAVPGKMPGGELLVGPDGIIYGTALLGGAADEGVVFRYSEALGLETLVEFTGIQGSAPGSAGASDGAGLIFHGGMVFGPDEKIYGVSPSGGPNGGGVVFRITPPTPLEDWKRLNLGDENALDFDDPDFDGLPNLLEYALLSDPVVPNPGAAPVGQITSFVDGDRLAIVVSRDPSRKDVTLVVEVSDGLDSWTMLATSLFGAPFTGPGYYDGDSAGPGVKSVTIRDVDPSSSHTRRFIRLRAEH